MNLKRVRNSWICFSILFFLSFFFGLFDRVDYCFYYWLHSFSSSFLTRMMLLFSFFGCWIGEMLVCFFVFLISKKKGLFLSFMCALAHFFNTIIKEIVARPRPSFVHLQQVSGYSFPSGHTMTSFVLFITLIYLFKDTMKKSYLLLLIPFLVGISRIYLGVHYLSDVIAGAVVGGLYVLIFIHN